MQVQSSPRPAAYSWNHQNTAPRRQGVIVKVKALVVEHLQPECGTASPGAGLVTVTRAVPLFAMSAAEICAVIVVLFTKVL